MYNAHTSNFLRLHFHNCLTNNTNFHTGWLLNINFDSKKVSKLLELILPYTNVCIALYTRCFPSVCGKKTSQATWARDSNPRPPAY